jgi:hypothetical protein
MVSSRQTSPLRKEKWINGLIYGTLAGVTYAGLVWGYDAYLLAQANAALPWLKLALGGTLAVVGLGFTGWLTARLDSPLLSALLWLISGVVLAWAAAYLSYGNLTVLLRLLAPDLLAHYSAPIGTIFSQRWTILAFLVGLASILIGLLELPLVEAAAMAPGPIGRMLPLTVCIPIALLLGLLTDNLVNEKQRAAILAMDELIRYALETEGQAVNPQKAAEMHLRAADPLRPYLHQERRLQVDSFDTELTVVNVLVGFPGTWFVCSTYYSKPNYCNPYEKGQPALPPAAGAQEQPPAPTAASTQAAAISTPVVSPTAGQQVTTLAGLDAAPRYTISLTLGSDGRTFQGYQDVAYTNVTSATLDSLVFRLLPNGGRSYGDGSLAVSQVQVNGAPVEAQNQPDTSVLQLRLPQPLPPGSQARIQMKFNGTVPLDFGQTEQTAGYGIFNFTHQAETGENNKPALPGGVTTLANSYPILAVYQPDGWRLDPVSSLGDSVFSQAAYYTVTLDAPAGWIPAATGVGVSSRVDGAQLQTTFVSGPARDFFLALSPDFTVASQQAGSVKVNSYSLPGDEAGGKRALQVAVDSLQIYNQKFGLYPSQELDIVETPLRYASGVEYPGIVLIGSNLYQNPGNPAFSVTVAHEVAHQWWYNVVGNDVFRQPWLDEALTSYSSALYLEANGGQPAVDGLSEYWQDRYQRSAQKGKDDRVSETLAHFESLDDPGVYGAIVYAKGALFFETLRQEIGDQAFFQALQHYYQDNHFQIADASALLADLEQAAGRSLQEFYKKWLYSP